MRRVLLAVLLAGAACANEASDDEGPLRLYGNVEIRDARLAFAESEIVASVEVEEGVRVEAGQLLARLRTERLFAELAEARARHEAQAHLVRRLENGTRPQRVEQARADVAAAQVRLANARRDLERVERTALTGASSEQDLDAARAALDVARAEVRVREAALDLALEGPREEEEAEAHAAERALAARVALLEARLRDTELRAPAAGVVQTRVLEPGEFADPGRAVLTLALTGEKWVRAWVSEPDLGRVREGQEATIASDTWTDRTFPGWVGFIAPTAEFTPKTVQTEDLRTRLVYEVRVWVEDPDEVLRLGMPVTVELAR